MNNLAKRIIAGIIGIPIILAAFYFGGLAYLAFAVTASSAALWEFISMMDTNRRISLITAGIIFSGAILITRYFFDADIFVMLSAVLILLSVYEIFLNEISRKPDRSLIIVSGIVYITLPFAYFGELNKYSSMNMMIFVIVLIWICDTAAYFGGKIFGKHKLSSISPGKTVEGSVSGFVFTAAVSAATHYIFPEYLGLIDAAAIGIITGIFSQAGDLFESMLKRHCGIKDSSGIIPGHGGMLDRFDSLLFTAPAVLIYLKYIK